MRNCTFLPPYDLLLPIHIPFESYNTSNGIYGLSRVYSRSVDLVYSSLHLEIDDYMLLRVLKNYFFWYFGVLNLLATNVLQYFV